MKKVLLFTMTMIAQLGAMAQWTSFPTMFPLGSGQVLTIDVGSTNQVVATAYHTNGSGYLCAYKYNFVTSLWDMYQDGQGLNVNFSNAAVASDGTIWTAVGGNSYKNSVVKNNAFTAVSASSNSVAVGCTGVFAGENVYKSNVATDVFNLFPTGGLKFDKVDIAQDGTMCGLFTYLGITYIARYDNTIGEWNQIGTSYTDIAVGDANKVLAVKGGQLFYFHVASSTWIRDLTAPANVEKVSLASDGTAYLLTSAASNNVYKNTWNKIACGADDLATNTTPLAQQNICSSNSTTLTASATGTVSWFANTTTLTPMGTGALITPTLATGTYTYYVANTLACGNSPRTAITVTVNAKPTSPLSSTTASALTICSGNTATLTVNNQLNTVNWYDSSTGGNFLGTGLSFVTPTLTANTVFYAEALSSAGCLSVSRSTFSVTVNSPLSVTSPTTSQLICSGNQASNITVNTTSVQWYTAPTGGALISTQTNFTTGTLTTTTTYYAQNQAALYCTPPRTPVTITVTPRPAAPLNTTPLTNQSVCYPNTTILSASGTGTLTWYTSATTTTILATGNTFTNSTINTNTTYYVEDKVGGCVSNTRTPITVTVNFVYAPGFIGSSPSSICSGKTATLTATGSPTIMWYDNATSTTALGTGTLFVTPTLTTNTTFYISSFANGCESTRSASTVTIKPLPTTPVDLTEDANFGSTLTICSGQSTVLWLNVASYWYTVPSGGSAFNISTSYSTPTLTNNTTYYVESNYNGCTSAPRVAITVTVTPMPSIVSQTVQNATCNGVSDGSIDLTVNNASLYTYSWTPNVSTTYSASGLPANLYTVQIINEQCVNTQTYNVTQPATYTTTVVYSSGSFYCTSYSGSPSFQWVDCNNSNAPIPGAVNSIFTPTVTGSYALVFGYGSCTNMLACNSVTVTATELNENVLLNAITLQPNPASTYFTLNNVVEGTAVSVIDVTGKVVASTSSATDRNNGEKTITIETNNLSNGIYIIQLKNNGVVAHKKLIISK